VGNATTLKYWSNVRKSNRTSTDREKGIPPAAGKGNDVIRAISGTSDRKAGPFHEWFLAASLKPEVVRGTFCANGDAPIAART
jgi:hypothetical protein